MRRAQLPAPRRSGPEQALVVLLLAASALGCDKSAPAPPAEQTQGERDSVVDGGVEQPDLPETVEHGTVPLPASVERVVSLAPSTTEAMFAMGAGERVVGVTRFCDYPPEVAPIPKVGGLTDANLEAIVALRPDLVIGVRSRSAQDLGRRLDSAKLAWVMLPVETLEDVRLSVRTLGRIVGQSHRGEEIARRLPKPASSEPTGPTVLLAFGRKPLIAAGPGTFGDQLIRAAGGRNALDGNDNPYPTIDRETLLELQPQVILDTSATVAEPWPAELEAVKRERVHTLDPALLRPGPRLDDALAQISAAISAAGDGP